MERRYDLKPSDDVSSLLNEIRELASRDLLPGYTRERAKFNVENARYDVKELIRYAKVARSAISDLQNGLRAFQQRFEYNPPLIEEILDIDLGPASDMTPEALEPFRQIEYSTDLFQNADSVLAGIANLPLRRRSGPIPNKALNKAVLACRNFWTKLGETWKMDGLEVASSNDEVKTLTGRCERFVADALGVSGFEFCLPDLRAGFQNSVKRKTAAKR